MKKRKLPIEGFLATALNLLYLQPSPLTEPHRSRYSLATTQRTRPVSDQGWMEFEL